MASAHSRRRTAAQAGACPYKIRVLAVLFVLAGFSCVSRPIPQPLPGQPVPGKTIATYRIDQRNQILGFLIHVEFESERLKSRFLVQNAFRQGIGFVDVNGRAYRYRILDGEAEHVATSTMEENLQAIFQGRFPLEIVRIN